MIEIKDPTREAVTAIIRNFESVSLESFKELITLINNTGFYADSLIKSNRLCNRIYKFKDIPMVKHPALTHININNACAFEVYCKLFKECDSEVNNFKEIKVTKGRYPFDFVASLGDKTYLITVLSTDGIGKLNHYNHSAYSESKDDSTIFVAIVPPNSKKDPETVKINGLHRTAKVSLENNKLICTYLSNIADTSM